MINRRTFVRNSLLAAATVPFAPRAIGAEPNHLQDPRTFRPAEIPGFIKDLPKAELHVHLEGTLEAEMKMELAKRNGMKLPYRTADELRASYNFVDLPSFIAVYNEGIRVLRTERDYYDLCFAYLKKAASQNVLYAEPFFDPQQHTIRGVRLEDVFGGFAAAREDARIAFGIQSRLIMSFNRDLGVDSAIATMQCARAHLDQIVGVGLDSVEFHNPPSKFAVPFAMAREMGLKVTVHCDMNQKDSLEHIREAIEDLRVDRIDHGGNVVMDKDLMAMARAANLYFDVCPILSGRVHTPSGDIDVVRAMLDNNVKFSINSDDPAYIHGNYIGEAYTVAAKNSNLTNAELVRIARQSFESTWLDPASKAAFLARVDQYGEQAASPTH